MTSFPLEVTSTTSAGGKMEDEESVRRNKELKVNSNEVSGEEFRRCSCVVGESLSGLVAVFLQELQVSAVDFFLRSGCEKSCGRWNSANSSEANRLLSSCVTQWRN